MPWVLWHPVHSQMPLIFASSSNWLSGVQLGHFAARNRYRTIQMREPAVSPMAEYGTSLFRPTSSSSELYVQNKGGRSLEICDKPVIV